MVTKREYKELKEDRFVTYMLRVFTLAEKKKKLIMFAGGGILVIVLAIPLLIHYFNVRAEEAAFHIYKASELRTPTGRLSVYREIQKKYPYTRSASTALFYEANVLFSEGDYEQALNLYTRFAAKYPHHFLVPHALISRGYCQEEMGNFPEAIACYREVIERVPDDYSSQFAFINIARCLELSGEFLQARDTYRQFLRKYPAGLKADEVTSQLERLERKILPGTVPQAGTTS